MAVNKDPYFPHFAGARNDRKIKRLRKELGTEGYGIYFMLLELLREQTDFNFPMSDLDLLAEDFGTSEQKVRVVICNYQLFEVDENQCFWSPKMIEHLQAYFGKSERGKNAANIRWAKYQEVKQIESMQMQSKCNANVEQMQSICNANVMQEEKRREKKRRE